MYQRKTQTINMKSKTRSRVGKSFIGTLQIRMLLFTSLMFMSAPLLVVIYVTTTCMGGCGAPEQRAGPFISYFPERDWRNDEVKTILLWTPNFGDPWWGQEGKDTFGKCQHKCKLSVDKDDWKNANALLFHSRAVWNYFVGYTMPSHHPPHQVWILNNGEPPPHVYLNMKAYNNVFNWTFWYRAEADVPTVTGRMVRIDNESISWQMEVDPLMKAAGRDFKDSRRAKYQSLYFQSEEGNHHKAKTKFLQWTASNCKDQARRQRIVRKLQKYLTFDTFGSCGDKELPCTDLRCHSILSPYRFSLAFENSLCRDYVTEKFWLALERGQIPITHGSSNYSRFVPRNSFIDVNDFDDVKSLAKYIKQVNSNETLYNRYSWWRKYYKIVLSPEPWCDLCNALHDKNKPAQVYSDLDGWYRNDTCPQFSISDIVARFVEGMLLKYNIIA